MKTYIGTVTGQDISINRDGDRNVRMLQVEVTEPDDVQTIQQVQWPGQDDAPLIGDSIIIVEISPSYKVAIAGYDNIEPTSEAGEKKIYSRDADGAVVASIYLKKTGEINIENTGGASVKLLDDGNVDINGSDDFAVRFSKLEEAFDEFIADFEAHSHEIPANSVIVSVSGGSGAPAVGTPNVTAIEVDPIDVETDADIAPAKVENVRLPS